MQLAVHTYLCNFNNKPRRDDGAIGCSIGDLLRKDAASKGSSKVEESGPHLWSKGDKLSRWEYCSWR